MLGMADYLSRQPSLSNKNIQIKAEELWNDWLTANKIDHEKIVLVEQNRRGTANQAISRSLASESEAARRSNGRQAVTNQSRRR